MGKIVLLLEEKLVIPGKPVMLIDHGDLNK
jgi:hypothetical protein